METKKQYYTCVFCKEDSECFLREERKLEGVKPFIVCEQCDCSHLAENFNGWANNHYWCECHEERFIKKTEANKGKWGTAILPYDSKHPHDLYVCKECSFYKVAKN